MRKMDSGFGGFDQYAGECRPSEYSHRNLQSCKEVWAYFPPLATRLVIIESSSRAIRQ